MSGRLSILGALRTELEASPDIKPRMEMGRSVVSQRTTRRDGLSPLRHSPVGRFEIVGDNRDRRGEIRRVQQGVNEFGTLIERTRGEKDQLPREIFANAKERINRLSSA